MGGVETVIATPIGSFGGFASASPVKDVGSGWASILTFHRTITRRSGGADALSLSFETHSRNFSPIGVGMPSHPQERTHLVSGNNVSLLLAIGGSRIYTKK